MNYTEGSIPSIFGAVSIVGGIIGILSGSVLGQKLRPRFKQSCDSLICGWTMLASVPLMFASLMLADVSIIAAIAVSFFAVILFYMSLALSGEIILVWTLIAFNVEIINTFQHLVCPRTQQKSCREVGPESIQSPAGRWRRAVCHWTGWHYIDNTWTKSFPSTKKYFSIDNRCDKATHLQRRIIKRRYICWCYANRMCNRTFHQLRDFGTWLCGSAVFPFCFPFYSSDFCFLFLITLLVHC